MKYFLILCLLFIGAPTLHAASYSVSPLLIENVIQPRDSFEESIKITNTTDHKLRIFPTVNEITVGDEGEVKTFVPASMSDNSDSVTSWISITRGRVEVNPGESIKIPVNFNINPRAVSGEYHAFIGFAEGEKRDDAEALVLAGRAPGVVIRLSMEEKKDEHLRLNKFYIQRFVISEKNKIAEYELENVGGQAIVPTGEIVFYNGRGVELKSVPVNPEQKSIQPGGKEKFASPLPDLGVIGHYKALLNVEYGEKQKANLYDTVFFNIVPILYLALLFGFLLLISVALVLYYHRSRNKHPEENEEVSVYVRSGKTGVEKDHDINLKN